jgi:threonine synthase
VRVHVGVGRATVVPRRSRTIRRPACAGMGHSGYTDRGRCYGVLGVCTACGLPLCVDYDLGAIRAAGTLTLGALAQRAPTLWRYREVLPPAPSRRAARRRALSDGRGDGARRHVEGVRRDGGARLDRAGQAPSPLGGFLCLRALRETQGTAVAVSEEAMEHGTRELAARSGIDTGTGLKYR